MGNLSFAAMALAVEALLASSAYAGAVAVTNPGFESPTGQSGLSITVPTGWTTFGNAGIAGAGNNVITPTQGDQAAWADEGGLYQDLGAITLGQDYSLSVDVIAPNGAPIQFSPDGYQIGLAYGSSPGLSNAQFFAEGSGLPNLAAGTHQRFTVSGNAPSSLGGSQDLFVYLFEDGTQYNGNEVGFDNVSVTYGSVGGVPELSTWATMALGFAALGFVRYRGSTKARAAAV